MKTYTGYDGRQVVIRETEENDLERSVRSFRSVAAEGIYLQTEEVPEDTVEVWRNRWKDNGTDSLFCVSEVEGDIVGGIVLIQPSRAKKNAHVRDLGMWIVEGYRGIGIGNFMMQYALDWARSKSSIKKITLGVYSSNLRAIRLYLRHGFHIEGSVKGKALINGKYVDEVAMGLELNRF